MNWTYLSHVFISKDWHRLLPLTNMHPTRRRLLELYRHMVNLIKTRPWTHLPLQPFDRNAYMHALLSRCPSIPEKFRMWILEWPSSCGMRVAWASFVECLSPEWSMRRHGISRLGYECLSPEPHAVVYDTEHCPSISFQHSSFGEARRPRIG